MSIINELIHALQYGFIIRALIVGALIGLSSAFLGVYLVIMRQSMIGDGLAHVSFLTIAIALFFKQSPILISLPIVIASAILIMLLDEKFNISNDSAIGLISSISVALAILISSLSSGFNADLYSYLFGSILTISSQDVILSVVLSIIVIVLITLNYNSLLIMSYDNEYASVIGVNVRAMKYLIAILTATTVVLGIRVVGTMLISSLILFPTISALQVSKSFKEVIAYGSIISVLSVIIGVFTSYLLDIPTGSTIVIVNAIVFVILLIRGRKYA